MKESLSRRAFIGSAVGASLGLGLKSASADQTPSVSASVPKKKASPLWPIWNSTEENAIVETLNSGHWGRGDGASRKVRSFEEAFSKKMNARY